eukprot:TRINITY_DN15048_c0_g1_i1.p1 TRINITY_DN15048_c0_g1~~TRINITY_DN15048_c0_g1_i1.p1  ORF type:complete len:1200 (+),score=183.82 TRINITY_DN15048_c0_g1_i1:2-3601(+)
MARSAATSNTAALVAALGVSTSSARGVPERGCSPEASVADEDFAPPRGVRTVFQRSSEEQVLRRAIVADLVRQASEPREEGLPSLGNNAASASSGGAVGAATHGGASGGSGGSGANARRVPGEKAQQPSACEGPLRFSSAFECGNLLCAKLIHPANTVTRGVLGNAAIADVPQELEYDLYVDSDTQSAVGHMQWFYFSVSTNNFHGTVHFRIVNLRKKKSLYQSGLQPYVYSVRRNRGWEHSVCDGLSYFSNSTIASLGRYRGGDIRADQNTLAFSYHVDFRDDEVFFASYPPYTYSMLNNFLNRLERLETARNNMLSVELCKSIGQLPVTLLVISEDIGKGDDGRGGRGAGLKRPRPCVAVIARQHPGEVVGSWAVQGLVKFLLGQSPAAQRLRETYVFHVVPMVNVDGVVHGNSRCTLAGVDPNRVWYEPNPIIHPVIYALKTHLRNIVQGVSVVGGACKSLDLFLDFHGHSAKFGCFFYGSCPSAPISNALFPKLCAVCSRDISFEQCHWRCPKSHRKTARYVVYKQLGVKYAYTMECSLYGPVPALGRSVGVASMPVPGPSAHAGVSVPTGAGIADEEAAAPASLAPSATTRRLLGAANSFTPNRVEWVGCAVGRVFNTFLNVSCESRSATDGDSCLSTDDLDSDRGHAHPENCKCSDTDFFLDISCPKALAKRPWLTLPLLEAATPKEVLESLIAEHGDHVPNGGQSLRGDGSDDAGDSDGDDLVELEGDVGSKDPEEKPEEKPSDEKKVDEKKIDDKRGENKKVDDKKVEEKRIDEKKATALAERYNFVSLPVATTPIPTGSSTSSRSARKQPLGREVASCATTSRRPSDAGSYAKVGGSGGVRQSSIPANSANGPALSVPMAGAREVFVSALDGASGGGSAREPRGAGRSRALRGAEKPPAAISRPHSVDCKSKSPGASQRDRQTSTPRPYAGGSRPTSSAICGRPDSRQQLPSMDDALCSGPPLQASTNFNGFLSASNGVGVGAPTFLSNSVLSGSLYGANPLGTHVPSGSGGCVGGVVGNVATARGSLSSAESVIASVVASKTPHGRADLAANVGIMERSEKHQRSAPPLPEQGSMTSRTPPPFGADSIPSRRSTPPLSGKDAALPGVASPCAEKFVCDEIRALTQDFDGARFTSASARKTVSESQGLGGAAGLTAGGIAVCGMSREERRRGVNDALAPLSAKSRLKRRD